MQESARGYGKIRFVFHCLFIAIHRFVFVLEKTVRERSSHVELVLEKLMSQFLLCSIGIRLSPKPVEHPMMQKLVLAGSSLGRRCEKKTTRDWSRCLKFLGRPWLKSPRETGGSLRHFSLPTNINKLRLESTPSRCCSWPGAGPC